MSDSVYSFRAGPTYRAASRQELFDSAMEQPLSLTSTFFDQAKGGMLESYGLGTAVRDFAIPDGAATPETTVRSALRLTNPLTAAYESTRLAVQAFREDSPTLDETKYKASPYYRENIPWDSGMTEARAKALAEWNDAKQVRQYYAQKRPISAFLGNLTGQAFDPINYVPVGGPLVKAAAVARAGRIGGAVITGAVDAATNTALAGLATRETRRRFGDDVSFQAMVSEIATAALIGAAFGGVSGVMDARSAASTLAKANRELATLKTTQEARIALNEAIDGVVRGEDVRLTPNATDAVVKATDAITAKGSPPPDVSSYLPTRELRKAYLEQYEVDGKQIASSRATPSTADVPPVGTWRIDDVMGLYGRDIEVLDEVAIDDLVLPEIRDGQLDAAKRGDDATYAAWIKEGKEPPPIELIRMEDGRLRVSDGHRRVLAAKASGLQTIKGWVSELADTGKVDAEGRPMKTSLTFELAQQSRSTGPMAADNAPARPTPAPEGRALAESRIAKPDNYKALADQYRVDPETGDFPELADIDQLRAEGRLTADDIAELDAASATVDDAKAYGEALKTVIGCIL